MEEGQKEKILESQRNVAALYLKLSEDEKKKEKEEGYAKPTIQNILLLK